MSDKYFYIICRDGQIIEVIKKEETFNAVSGAMINKGLVVLKEYGSMLNGVDISKVLNENQYDAWVSSTMPKEYIKDGTWRDGKEKKVIRYEKWKEDEINNQIKLEAPKEEEMSDEDKIIYKKHMKEMFKKYRPAFMKNTESLIPPHDPNLTARQKSIAETKDIDY